MVPRSHTHWAPREWPHQAFLPSLREEYKSRVHLYWGGTRVVIRLGVDKMVCMTFLLPLLRHRRKPLRTGFQIHFLKVFGDGPSLKG